MNKLVKLGICGSSCLNRHVAILVTQQCFYELVKCLLSQREPEKLASHLQHGSSLNTNYEPKKWQKLRFELTLHLLLL